MEIGICQYCGKIIDANDDDSVYDRKIKNYNGFLVHKGCKGGVVWFDIGD